MTKGDVQHRIPQCYEFTEKERDRIQELRKRFSDTELTEEQQEDTFLVRWLRARNLDVGKSEDMLRKSLKWRKDNNIDGILERESVPPEICEIAPFGYCGINDDGYPIFIAPMGKHDGRTMLEKYGIEYMQRINIINMEKICEMLREESQRQGRPITQIVEILDMDGYSYRQMSSKLCRDFMISMQQVMDAHYPELLRYCAVINAPKMFAILFAMLKPFIPQNTLDKVEVFGIDDGRWRNSTTGRFPLHKIPPHWGGSLDGVDEYCSGSDVWIQGPKDVKSFFTGVDESVADYTAVTVNARDKITKEIEIAEKNSIIEWKFKTENYDIGFQIVCSRSVNNESGAGDKAEEILPYSRVDAQNTVQEGTYTCQVPGKYSFIFDNSFSLLKGKTLLYKINVVVPEDPVHGGYEDCTEF